MGRWRWRRRPEIGLRRLMRSEVWFSSQVVPVCWLSEPKLDARATRALSAFLLNSRHLSPTQPLRGGLCFAARSQLWLPRNPLGRSSASNQSFPPRVARRLRRCSIWRPRGRSRAASSARRTGSRRWGGRTAHRCLGQRRTLLRSERRRGIQMPNGSDKNSMSAKSLSAQGRRADLRSVRPETILPVAANWT